MRFNHPPLRVRQIALVTLALAAMLLSSGRGPHGESRLVSATSLESHRPRPLNTFRNGLLVLLCHKRMDLLRWIFRVQHGHLDRRLASATTNRRRRVAIEFGMWRSGLIGGASGSMTGGKLKRREASGGTRSRGGNRSALGDQEAVR